MNEPLSIEEYVEEQEMVAATAADGVARCRVYRIGDPVVVLGRGSRAELELDEATCADDRVPVRRRSGGGCAVVLDPGNLIVAVSLKVPGLGRNLEHFARLSEWIAAALARLGWPGVLRQGHSDLALGERKIGGACIRRTRDLLHYGTTILVNPEVALMERYLRHPPREPAYRHRRPHREFVGALRPGASLEEMRRLEGALRDELRLDQLSLASVIEPA